MWLSHAEDEAQTNTNCKKDLGATKRLQRYVFANVSDFFSLMISKLQPVSCGDTTVPTKQQQ